MNPNETVVLSAWQIVIGLLGSSAVTALVQHFLQRPDRLWREVRDLWDAQDRQEKRLSRYRKGYSDLVKRYIAGQRRVIELVTQLCNGCEKKTSLVEALNVWRAEDLREPFSIDDEEEEESQPPRKRQGFWTRGGRDA